MQDVFNSNPNYDINSPILDTQTTFFVDDEGRLYRILFRSESSFDGIREHSWGSEKRDFWAFEGDVNEENLIDVFQKLALGNYKDFQNLYAILKKNDPKAFPYIRKTLEIVQEIYNFD